jgi:hypothetical protein
VTREKREEVVFNEGSPSIPYDNDNGSGSSKSTCRWISTTKVKISDEKMTGPASRSGLNPDRLSGASTRASQEPRCSGLVSAVFFQVPESVVVTIAYL